MHLLETIGADPVLLRAIHQARIRAASILLDHLEDIRKGRIEDVLDEAQKAIKDVLMAAQDRMHGRLHPELLKDVQKTLVIELKGRAWQGELVQYFDDVGIRLEKSTKNVFKQVSTDLHKQVKKAFDKDIKEQARKQLKFTKEQEAKYLQSPPEEAAEEVTSKLKQLGSRKTAAKATKVTKVVEATEEAVEKAVSKAKGAASATTKLAKLGKKGKASATKGTVTSTVAKATRTAKAVESEPLAAVKRLVESRPRNVDKYVAADIAEDLVGYQELLADLSDTLAGGFVKEDLKFSANQVRRMMNEIEAHAKTLGLSDEVATALKGIKARLPAAAKDAEVLKSVTDDLLVVASALGAHVGAGAAGIGARLSKSTKRTSTPTPAPTPEVSEAPEASEAPKTPEPKPKAGRSRKPTKQEQLRQKKLQTLTEEVEKVRRKQAAQQVKQRTARKPVQEVAEEATEQTLKRTGRKAVGEVTEQTVKQLAKKGLLRRLGGKLFGAAAVLTLPWDIEFAAEGIRHGYETIKTGRDPLKEAELEAKRRRAIELFGELEARLEMDRKARQIEDIVQERAELLATKAPSVARILAGLPLVTKSEVVVGGPKPNTRPIFDFARLSAKLQGLPMEAEDAAWEALIRRLEMGVEAPVGTPGLQESLP